jgi:hypothetical protein
MDSPHVIYTQATWFAFIPADSTHAAQWIDLNEIAIFDWVPDETNPTVHIILRSGITQKYRHQRAAHLLTQWQLFKTKQPRRDVMEIS